MPLAILASNYIDEARKMHTKLESLLGFLVPRLDKNSIKKGQGEDQGTSKVKAEPVDDLDDPFMESPINDTDDVEDVSDDEANASKSGAKANKDEVNASSDTITGHEANDTALPANRLPGIFVSMIGGHTCKWAELLATICSGPGDLASPKDPQRAQR